MKENSLRCFLGDREISLESLSVYLSSSMVRYQQRIFLFKKDTKGLFYEIGIIVLKND